MRRLTLIGAALAVSLGSCGNQCADGDPLDQPLAASQSTTTTTTTSWPDPHGWEVPTTSSSTTTRPPRQGGGRVSRHADSARPVLQPTGGAAPTAKASWYGRGARTANGEAFDPDGLTFAHLTMPFGTRVEFCHDDRCVTARCTDRGPAAWTGRTFDLSRGAFTAIAPLSAGVVDVTWRIIE